MFQHIITAFPLFLGKGDLLSLAEAIGGNLSKVAFNAFLTHLGIEVSCKCRK